MFSILAYEKSILWALWSIALLYISFQDLRQHSFSAISVIFFGIITLWICPLCVGDLLLYGGLFGFLKNFGEWKWNTTYLGWGDVEILALLSSQSTNVPEFFMISGGIGALLCLFFYKRGIPFVPVMSLSWYILESGYTFLW
ncbi:hypothetical protein P618_201113 [Holospora obtusa F1]|uniref:Type IV leader peptidase family protein n=1 Tax=Holospora obtusa F1 TaxID=1399147 RepID=W6TCZ6_HOLOB|nr:hypothetical protein [Holospora obtusa]ETZ06708.1 hypothetical protein P618_201113 [Holospora obtusa F1]